VNALRNGIGVFEVARNMGTSVQMIQEYYGKQATSAVFARLAWAIRQDAFRSREKGWSI
jgi:hypothetical protein